MKKNEETCPENKHVWHKVYKASNSYQVTYFCRKCWEERREIQKKTK